MDKQPIKLSWGKYAPSLFHSKYRAVNKQSIKLFWGNYTPSLLHCKYRAVDKQPIKLLWGNYAPSLFHCKYKAVDKQPINALVGKGTLLRQAHIPLSGQRHINATKELLLFYANLVALYYMSTSSRLAMATFRPLTLPSDPYFLF